MQKWLLTWEGIATAITAAIAATIALVRALPPAVTLIRRLIDGSVFLIDIRDTMAEFRKEVAESFKRVEDGQLNQIHARRFNLDADQTCAYFETDPMGKTEWVSRRWRDMTGLDNSEARGAGWQNGIAPENEDAVVRAWQFAIEQQRTFDMVVGYVDRNGRRTTMHVIASPMRDRDGNVMQFHGICTPPDSKPPIRLNSPCPSES